MRLLYAAVLGSTTLCCQSQPKNSDATATAQAEPAGSGEKNDKLARALASAIEPGKAENAGPGKTDGTPPPDGVLEPGKADSLAPPHSPPRLDLGSTGTEPRVKLTHRALKGTVLADLQFAVDLGMGQGIPPVDFKFELKPNGATASVQNVTARVVSAEMSMPNLPEELRGQLRKLKGSKFTLKIAENGGAFDCAQDTTSNKNPEFNDLLDMVGLALLDASMALPTESVGVGAYWLITSRQQSLGMGWVAYDMVKVDEVNASAVKLSISTRRYVIGREMPGPAQPGGGKLSVREAMSTGTAQGLLPVTGSLMSSYERTHSERLLLDASDGSGQRVLQAGGQAKFSSAR